MCLGIFGQPFEKGKKSVICVWERVKAFACSTDFFACGQLGICIMCTCDQVTDIRVHIYQSMLVLLAYKSDISTVCLLRYLPLNVCRIAKAAFYCK
jgi:hypothetical protein